MSDAETIARAKRAWRRIRKRGKMLLIEWLLIGEALSVGRKQALQAAKCNRPFGVRYQKAMAGWLKETGFNEISDNERYKALICFERKDQILAWLATLPENRQRSMNHPNHVMREWRALPRRKAIATSEPDPVIVRAMHRGKWNGWTEDAILRGCEAYHMAPSRNVIAIVKAIAGALIRDDDDLMELLSSADAQRVTTHGQHIHA